MDDLQRRGLVKAITQLNDITLNIQEDLIDLNEPLGELWKHAVLRNKSDLDWVIGFLQGLFQIAEEEIRGEEERWNVR